MKKVYKTRVVLEFVHEGEFKPFEEALLQTPGAISYLGDVPASHNHDPIITKFQTKSEAMDKKKYKKLLGEDDV